MSTLETQTYTYWKASTVLAQEGMFTMWFGQSASTLWQVARYAASDHLRNAALNTLQKRGYRVELRPGPNGGGVA